MHSILLNTFSLGPKVIFNKVIAVHGTWGCVWPIENRISGFQIAGVAGERASTDI